MEQENPNKINENSIETIPNEPKKNIENENIEHLKEDKQEEAQPNSKISPNCNENQAEIMRKQREWEHKYIEEEEVLDRPLYPWEVARRQRIAEEEAEEKRQMKLMAEKAEKERIALLESIKSSSKKEPKVQETPQTFSEDADEGWREVMEIAKSMRPNIPSSEVKKIRSLYYNMKE